jgi:hypothetical protein
MLSIMGELASAISIFERHELIDNRIVPSIVMGIGQMKWDFSLIFFYLCRVGEQAGA